MLDLTRRLRLVHNEAVDMRSPHGLFLSILSASYGGGHQRVGEAIAEEWQARIGGRVEIVDYFTRFTSPTFFALTKFWYYQAVRFAPGIQAKFYNMMGEIRPDSRFRRAVNRTGMDRLDRYLADTRPDVVCCVHWTFTGTMSDLKIEGRTTVPCLTAITDYVSHGEWIHPRVDRYAVPHAVMRDGLLARGIPPDRIIVSGMPIARKFQRSLDRAALAARLGLTPGIPVVLVIAGAYATLGRIGDIVRVLARFPRPIQALVVCANARRLAGQVRAAGARSPHRFWVFGYVNNVEELMTVSDVLIGKAGGVTVSEALAKRLPMLLYGSIPGQEESNAQFLVGQGAAVAASTPGELAEALEALLARPERLGAMRHVAARLSRPDAAAVVVAHLAQLVTGSGPAAEEPLSVRRLSS
jgi:processive 1,2-diacylglycerol beta-glucosyltransferase